MILKNRSQSEQDNTNLSSVICSIPFYSRCNPDHFYKSIESILTQSYPLKEIILVQDGPVGRELKYIRDDYCNRYDHIKCIQISQNCGLAHALNVSILESQSKYYARMDSDDISHPDRIKKEVEFLEQNPDIGIVGSWAVEFIKYPSERNGFLKRMPIQHSDLCRMFHYRNPFIHPSVMIRRSVFADIGVYNAGLRHEEDYELWGRALSNGIRLANIPEVLLFFRSDGMLQRRSVVFKARYSYNTWSPLLNLLKIISISFRYAPHTITKWAYRNLR